MLMISQEQQQMGGELKGLGELMQQLQHGVEELQEDGRAFVGEMGVVGAVAATVLKFVAEGAPVVRVG